jgi:hypothetical protein
LWVKRVEITKEGIALYFTLLANQAENLSHSVKPSVGRLILFFILPKNLLSHFTLLIKICRIRSIPIEISILSPDDKVAKLDPDALSNHQIASWNWPRKRKEIPRRTEPNRNREWVGEDILNSKTLREIEMEISYGTISQVCRSGEPKSTYNLHTWALCKHWGVYTGDDNFCWYNVYFIFFFNLEQTKIR